MTGSVHFFHLHHFRIPLILSVSGSCLIVFDVEQSKLILVGDLEEEICCCCICGADIFVLLRGIAVPRKYTLCSRIAVVKRLLAKSLPVQCAQFMILYKCCTWPSDLVNSTTDALAPSTKKVKSCPCKWESFPGSIKLNGYYHVNINVAVF
ncbi:hypothetical protein COOONC_00109 [Cooperia oncophora]